MNKKVITFTFAVAAMGLTSCNKSWPLVTDEESKTIVKNILNVDAVKKLMKDDLSGLNNIVNFKANVSNKETKGNIKIIDGTYNLSSNLNVDKNYFDLDLSAEVINEGGKSIASTKQYMTYNTGKSYILTKESKSGEYSEITEDQHKEKIKKQIYGSVNTPESEYSYLALVGKGYKILTGWDTTIANLKTLHEQYKDNKEFYVNYETRSNNKTDSAQFILDAKTNKDIFEVSNTNKDPDYIYVINKIDFTYTHGLITKMSYTWEGKYKDEDNIDTVETNKASLDSISFGSASVDNINLNDYYTVKEQ